MMLHPVPIDAERHLSTDALAQGLADLPDPPRDRGTIVALFRRPSEGCRERVERVALTLEGGFSGDRWSAADDPDPHTQLAVMEAGVGAMVANGQPMDLFGDNLVVDLALDAENLPVGSLLQCGDVKLQVTPMPHNGCSLYRARFGEQALRFISQRALKARRLRGIYLQVVEPGQVAVGDAIIVLQRG